jgi:thiamine pyridinylase
MKNITFRRHYRAAIASAIVLGATLLSAAAQAQQTLNVALYPYVPRIDQFKAAITAAWSKKHPGVQLNFLKSEVCQDGHCVKVWDGG